MSLSLPLFDLSLLVESLKLKKQETWTLLNPVWKGLGLERALERKRDRRLGLLCSLMFTASRRLSCLRYLELIAFSKCLCVCEVRVCVFCPACACVVCCCVCVCEMCGVWEERACSRTWRCDRCLRCVCLALREHTFLISFDVSLLYFAIRQHLSILRERGRHQKRDQNCEDQGAKQTQTLSGEQLRARRPSVKHSFFTVFV